MITNVDRDRRGLTDNVDDADLRDHRVGIDLAEVTTGILLYTHANKNVKGRQSKLKILFNYGCLLFFLSIEN